MEQSLFRLTNKADSARGMIAVFQRHMSRFPSTTRGDRHVLQSYVWWE